MRGSGRPGHEGDQKEIGFYFFSSTIRSHEANTRPLVKVLH